MEPLHRAPCGGVWVLGSENGDFEAMTKQEEDAEPVSGGIEELEEAEEDVAAIRIARPGST